MLGLKLNRVCKKYPRQRMASYDAHTNNKIITPMSEHTDYACTSGTWIRPTMLLYVMSHVGYPQKPNDAQF